VKSFKYLLVIVLVVVFILGGLSLAMAAVTAPFSFPDSRAELSVRTGTVDLQTFGETTWVTVTGTTEVFPGDSVRTGNESDASINLYDQGVLHLAPNSTMVLEESLWDPENPSVFQGEVFLEAGDLWSRLFDFVSPDSDFEVRTSSTVATVRGTTFWVGAMPNNTSRVYVDDHTVSVRSLEGRGTLEVTDGQQVRVYREGRQSMLNFAETPTGADLVIIEKYRKWDADYEAEVKARQLAFARQVRRIDPDSSLYSFQRLSERVRLALATDEQKQEELRTRFMTGRVLDAYIEFADHENLPRTRILLQHAQEFEGLDTTAKPTVKRALLYFGRNQLAEPAKLEELLDEQPVTPVKELEPAEVEMQPVTEVEVEIIPGTAPVVQGVTTDVPTDTKPTYSDSGVDASIAPIIDEERYQSGLTVPIESQPVEVQPLLVQPSLY
jgi:hypothetical protein